MYIAVAVSVRVLEFIYSIVNYSRVINEIAAIDCGCHRRNADD